MFGVLHDHAAPRVDRTRGGDADADDAPPELSDGAVHGAARKAASQARRIAAGPSATGVRLLTWADSRAIVDHDGRANVRAADVERENGSC